jgi:hypothetical protein
MAAAPAGKQFDRDLFCKLVLLMDSPNEFERQRASAQALQLCVAARVRFFDAAAEVCGKDSKRVTALETQLEEARRGGDELADELRRKDAVIDEYRKTERSRKRYCHPCESKRRTIAGLMGLMILAAWLSWYPPRHVPVRQTGFGALLASLPLIFLFVRWRVICFKRKHHWVTWRNNDVFRAAASRWNRFLGKFVIEE